MNYLSNIGRTLQCSFITCNKSLSVPETVMNALGGSKVMQVAVPLIATLVVVGCYIAYKKFSKKAVTLQPHLRAPRPVSMDFNPWHEKARIKE